MKFPVLFFASLNNPSFILSTRPDMILLVILRFYSLLEERWQIHFIKGITWYKHAFQAVLFSILVLGPWHFEEEKKKLVPDWLSQESTMQTRPTILGLTWRTLGRLIRISYRTCSKKAYTFAPFQRGKKWDLKLPTDFISEFEHYTCNIYILSSVICMFVTFAHFPIMVFIFSHVT